MKILPPYWGGLARCGFKTTSEPNKEYKGLLKPTIQRSEVKTLHFLYVDGLEDLSTPVQDKRRPFLYQKRNPHPALEFLHSQTVNKSYTLGKESGIPYS
ncbi:hypothetical protein O181_016183 [Austropuccinia psidii MF-1]|uniref:Uncharacterized protein n=1 Tax=Austropuccinia psidii MF-1 TaxID=1389203 RepID=A0A9Q3GQM4_9BASI|nr:hypothetical protein [Austropuccinia psidii MF-1]